MIMMIYNKTKGLLIWTIPMMLIVLYSSSNNAKWLPASTTRINNAHLTQIYKKQIIITTSTEIVILKLFCTDQDSTLRTDNKAKLQTIK